MRPEPWLYPPGQSLTTALLRGKIGSRLARSREVNRGETLPRLHEIEIVIRRSTSKAAST